MPGVRDAVDVEVAKEVCVRTKSGEIHCSTLRGENRVVCRHYFDDESETFGLGDVVALAGDDNHWCALTRDGTLTCMGDNHWGQLGVLPPTVITVPSRSNSARRARRLMLNEGLLR